MDDAGRLVEVGLRADDRTLIERLLCTLPLAVSEVGMTDNEEERTGCCRGAGLVPRDATSRRL